MSGSSGKGQIWSTREDGTPYKRHAYSPEEELNFENLLALCEERQISSLDIHTAQHWKAHLQSGHDSPITKLMMTQCVDLYECNAPDCTNVERDIQYASSMMLQVARVSESSSTIPLRTLLASNLEESFAEKSLFEDASYTDRRDRARPCRSSRHKQQNQSLGELTKKVRRITRAPPLFTLEINRRRDIESLNLRKDMSEQATIRLAKEHIILQRISDYQQLNMAEWSTNDTLFSSEQLAERNLSATYAIHGIVTYNHERKHYTLFVKSRGIWVYFDDLAPSPVYRDPFTDWPENFVEHMLLFKITSSDTVLASIEQRSRSGTMKAGASSKIAASRLSTIVAEASTGRFELPIKNVTNISNQSAADFARAGTASQATTNRMSGILTVHADSSEPYDLDQLKAQIQHAFEVVTTKDSHDLADFVHTIYSEKAKQCTENATYMKRDFENLAKQYETIAKRLKFFEGGSSSPKTPERVVEAGPAPRMTPEQFDDQEEIASTLSSGSQETHSQSQAQIYAAPAPQVPQSPTKRNLRASTRNLLQRGKAKSSDALKNVFIPGRSKNASPQGSPRKSARKRKPSNAADEDAAKRSRRDQDEDAPAARRFF